MKSVVARFTEVKKDVSNLDSDIDLEGFDINKVDTALKSVGIQLKDEIGQIRDLDNVFLELSEKWNTLDRNTQRYIATIAAGSRQQSRFIALMENYERTIELIEIANNSAGRSGKQFEKYAGSVENKINRLKNTWEQFKLNLIDEKTYKKGIDFVNNFLNRFTKIDKIDLGTIAAWGIIVGKTFFSNMLKAAKDASNLVQTYFEKIGKDKRTRIQIQTNINDIEEKLKSLDTTIEKLKDEKSAILINIGNASSGFADFETIEEKLNQLNLTLDKTKSEFTFLDLSTDEWKNSLKQATQETGMSEAVFNQLSSVIDRESEELRENTNNLRANNQERERQNQLLAQEQASFKAKTRNQLIGNTLASSATTIATSAITGTMTAEETTKTIGLSTMSTGLSAAFSGGGPWAIAIAVIGLLTTTVLPKLVTAIKENIDKWKEDHDAVYAAQKAHERAAEEAEKLAKEYDEVNQRYNKVAEQYTNIEKNVKAYKELNEKVILTEEDQEEYNKVVNDLKEQLPELKVYYDSQGNAIKIINSSLEEQLKIQKELYIVEKERNLIAQNNSIVGSIKDNQTNIDFFDKKKDNTRENLKQVNLSKPGAGFTGMTWSFENGQDIYEGFKELAILNEEAGQTQDAYLANIQQGLNTLGEDFLTRLHENYSQLVGTTFDFNKGGWSEVLSTVFSPNSRENDQYKEQFIQAFDETIDDIVNDTLTEDEKKQYDEAVKAVEQGVTDLISSAPEELDVYLRKTTKNLKSENQELILNIIKNSLDMGDLKQKLLEAISKDNFNSETFYKEYFSNLTLGDANLSQIANSLNEMTHKEQKLVEEYYNRMSTMTKEERDKFVKDFKGTPIADLIRNQNEEIEKQIEKETTDGMYNYSSKEREGTSIIYSSKLKDEFQKGKLAEGTISNFYEKLNNISSTKGIEAARSFYMSYTSFLSNKKMKKIFENDQLFNYFLDFDWEKINPININSTLSNIGRQLFEDGLVKSAEEGTELAQEWLNKNKISLGLHTELKDANDVNVTAEYANEITENLQNYIDGLNPLFKVKGDVILEQKDVKQLTDTFDKMKKDLEHEGLDLDIDIGEYITEKDGKQVISEKDKEKLIQDIKDAIGDYSDLINQYNELNTKKEEDLTAEDKELLKALEKKINLFKYADELIDYLIDKAQEEYDPFSNIASSLLSIEGNYKNAAKEIKDNGILSVDTIDSFNSSLGSLNKELKDVGINGFNFNKIFSSGVNGFLLNEQEFINEIQTIISQLKGSDLWKDISETTKNTLELLPKKIEEIKLELLKEEWEKYTKAAEDAAEAIKKAKEEQEEFVKSMGSLVSNYKSAASEMIKNGKITSSTYSTLAEDLKKINERYNLKLNISDYVDASGGFNWIKYEADITTFIKKLKEEGVEADYLTQVLNDLKDAHEELDKELEDVTEEYKKSLEEVKEKTKSVKEANKSLSDAYKDLAEKEKKVTEAQEALNETLYGTGNKRKSTLDGMYNYEQLLDTIDSDIESIKNNLEHIGPGDNISELVNNYGQAMKNKKVNLEAQKVNYSRNLNSIMNNLGQYSSYYTMQNGRLLADVAALNAASMNDKIKDYIENQIEAYNNSAKKISEIDKQIKQVEQDFLDFKKAYRDKYINLQEKVISTMKEEAQKELQTQQEKYAAMEEADNEYTNALEEAIQKQRELRDQANEWEDLAQKEKKLSLLQRDTSGANQKEVLKQQEDIEKSRQNLLDKGIDNIIKGLKDLYSDQKKTRDAELKYQQAVLDNATFIEEANAVINSWQTADDLITWFMEHGTEVQNMTNEQLEKYAEELEQLYNDREIYMNTSMEDFTNMLNVQEEEIDNVVTNTAEWLTFESTRALNEVMEEVDKAIEKAREDIQNALDDVEDAKEKIVEAIENVAKAVKELETANKNATEAAEKLANVQAKVNEAKQETNNNQPKDINLEDKKLTWNTSVYEYKALGQITGMVLDGNQQRQLAKDVGVYVSNIDGVTWYADTFAKLREKMGDHGTYIDPSGNFQQFATGGLVNYTGPAWVDGTPAQPEAFLSAKDTQMISNFTDVLRSLYTSIGSSNSQQVNPSIGDTHIEVHINIESVASDYDVDSAVERVKQDIIDAANQTGRNVILYQ